MTSGRAARRLRNVILGDVFYCTGQSNMALPIALHSARDAPPVAQAMAAQARRTLALRPAIRLAAQDLRGNGTAPEPWRRADEAALDGFSAVCWFFGAALYAALQPQGPGEGRAHPIGLISAAWPATAIHCWLRDRHAIARCQAAAAPPPSPPPPRRGAAEPPRRPHKRHAMLGLCRSVEGPPGCKRFLGNPEHFIGWMGYSFLYNQGALRVCGGGTARDALEGEGPSRRPQKRLDGRLEKVAEAVGGAVGEGCRSGWGAVAAGYKCRSNLYGQDGFCYCPQDLLLVVRITSPVGSGQTCH